MASRAVAVVVTGHEVIAVVILELLLQGKVVERSSKSKLPVNFLLGDVEVLDIEEALRIVSFKNSLGGCNYRLGGSSKHLGTLPTDMLDSIF